MTPSAVVSVVMVVVAATPMTKGDVHVQIVDLNHAMTVPVVVEIRNVSLPVCCLLFAVTEDVFR